MNSDLFTNIDFEEFYLDYKNCKNDMSVAAFSVNIDVPYAVLETKVNKITAFTEKPTYTYHSNAGIYLFKQKFVKVIPKNEQYDAIDLMTYLIENKMQAGHFPIVGYWLDIGRPDDYMQAIEQFDSMKEKFLNG